jgi:hypothetical protein
MGINLLSSSHENKTSVNITNAGNTKVTVANNILENITGATNYHTKVGYDSTSGSLVFHDKLISMSDLAGQINAATGIADVATYNETTGGITYSKNLLTTDALSNYYRK